MKLCNLEEFSTLFDDNELVSEYYLPRLSANHFSAPIYQKIGGFNEQPMRQSSLMIKIIVLEVIDACTRN